MKAVQNVRRIGLPYPMFVDAIDRNVRADVRVDGPSPRWSIFARSQRLQQWAGKGIEPTERRKVLGNVTWNDGQIGLNVSRGQVCGWPPPLALPYAGPRLRAGSFGSLWFHGFLGQSVLNGAKDSGTTTTRPEASMQKRRSQRSAASDVWSGPWNQYRPNSLSSREMISSLEEGRAGGAFFMASQPPP